MPTKGYASPEVERLYAQAMTLCQQAAEAVELFSSLWGLFYFHFVRAHFHTARDLGTQCLAIAQRAQDPLLLLLAHEAMGILLFHCGEFAAAREHLEEGSALYSILKFLSLDKALDASVGPGQSCSRFVFERW